MFINKYKKLFLCFSVIHVMNDYSMNESVVGIENSVRRQPIVASSHPPQKPQKKQWDPKDPEMAPLRSLGSRSIIYTGFLPFLPLPTNVVSPIDLQSSKGIYFGRLPDEMIRMILSYLDPHTLGQLRQTNRFWSGANRYYPYSVRLISQESTPLIQSDTLWYNYTSYPVNGPLFSVLFTNLGFKNPPYRWDNSRQEPDILAWYQECDQNVGIYGPSEEECPEKIMPLIEEPLFIVPDCNDSDWMLIVYEFYIQVFKKGGADIRRQHEFQASILSVSQTEFEWVVNVGSMDGHSLAEGWFLEKGDCEDFNEGQIFEGPEPYTLLESRNDAFFSFTQGCGLDSYVSIFTLMDNRNVVHPLYGFEPHHLVNTQDRRRIYAFNRNQHMWVDTTTKETGIIADNKGTYTHAWPVGKDGVLVEFQDDEESFSYKICRFGENDWPILSPLGDLHIAFVDSDKRYPVGHRDFKDMILGIIDHDGNLVRHKISIQFLHP